jgi:hypothetical protein
VAGHVEGEAIVFDGPAPTTDLVGLLDEQSILTQVVSGAKPGGSCSYDDDGTSRI